MVHADHTNECSKDMFFVLTKRLNICFFIRKQFISNYKYIYRRKKKFKMMIPTQQHQQQQKRRRRKRRKRRSQFFLRKGSQGGGGDCVFLLIKYLLYNRESQ
jgi:hypothetical protein